MIGALRFGSHYLERVWGGRRLEEGYGRLLPGAGRYGEAWELVDREEVQSVVVGGELTGLSLNELWTERRREVFGVAYEGHAAERFPLLFKILDAREALSVQVHPPAREAARLGGEVKDEVWYVAEAEPGARLYAGLREGVTREGFERAVATGEVEGCLQVLLPREGDVLALPSGRVHAIGGGLVLYEVQLNSDTTYRVYDWGRPGLDGFPRELHVAESLRCIDFDDVAPELVRLGGAASLVEMAGSFAVERRELGEGMESLLAEGGRFCVCVVVEGRVGCGGEWYGESELLLLPAGAPPLVGGAGGSVVLRVSLSERD